MCIEFYEILEFKLLKMSLVGVVKGTLKIATQVTISYIFKLLSTTGIN